MAAELFLLDTSILIHLIRQSPAGKAIVAEYSLGQQTDGVISVVTVGEARAFARKIGWAQTKLDRLDSLLDEVVVLDINREEVLRAYADIDYFCARTMKPARSMGKNDLWIAATAKAAHVHLLTIDSDFDHLFGPQIKGTRHCPNTGQQV